MDRVCFLIESTGERLSCMLNPETLEISRTAGVYTLPSLRGVFADTACDDDAVFYGGGGRTELRLNLLFDIEVAGSSITTQNVRDLTAPLWKLSENAAEAGTAGRLPLVRFIWGRNWNIPGVITAIAERFDSFSAAGDPQRSWLSMRFRRVNEPGAPPETPPLTNAEATSLAAEFSAEGADGEPTGQTGLTGLASELNADEDDGPDRPDIKATKRFGHPSYWRLWALLKGLINPYVQTASPEPGVPPPAPSAAPPEPSVQP